MYVRFFKRTFCSQRIVFTVKWIAKILTDALSALFHMIVLRVFGSVNPSRVVSSYPREHYGRPRIRCSEKPHVSLMGVPTDGQYLSLCSPLLFCVISLSCPSAAPTQVQSRRNKHLFRLTKTASVFKFNSYKYHISLK